MSRTGKARDQERVSGLWAAIGLLVFLNLALWTVVMTGHGGLWQVIETEILLRGLQEDFEVGEGDLLAHVPPHRQEELQILLSTEGSPGVALKELRDSLQKAAATVDLPASEIRNATAPVQQQFLDRPRFLRELARGGVSEEQLASWLIQNRQELERLEPREPQAGAGSQRQALPRSMERRPELWQLPELRRARHIFLIAPKSITEPAEIEAQGERIEQIAQRLDAGEDFSALARRYSEDEATRPQGGLLPLFTLDQLPPVLRREMSRLHPGDVAGPFYEPALGWHLVRLEEIVPARAVEPREVEAWFPPVLSIPGVE